MKYWHPHTMLLGEHPAIEALAFAVAELKDLPVTDSLQERRGVD